MHRYSDDDTDRNFSQVFWSIFADCSRICSNPVPFLFLRLREWNAYMLNKTLTCCIIRGSLYFILCDLLTSNWCDSNKSLTKGNTAKVKLWNLICFYRLVYEIKYFY